VKRHHHQLLATFDRPLEEGEEGLRGGAPALGGLARVLEGDPEGALRERREQILAGGEVAVERPRGQPGSFGDRQRGDLGASLAQQPLRRVEQQFPVVHGVAAPTAGRTFAHALILAARNRQGES
jgi:hypothetical protein